MVILQQLEGNLIYPRVVGKSVGLPGIWVLAAVTIGGNAFGLAGMLVSVPLCSVLYALARQAVNARLVKKGPDLLRNFSYSGWQSFWLPPAFFPSFFFFERNRPVAGIDQ